MSNCPFGSESSDCEHIFVFNECVYICELCCEERLFVEQSSFDNYNYLITSNNENIYNFIKDLNKEVKNKIILNFEVVTEHEKKTRGDNKKAILAVSYFFNTSNYICANTEKDAYKKFFITKKKFGIGKKLFLKHFKEYNDIEVFISSYVQNVFLKYPNKFSPTIILYICKYVDSYKKLSNFNPYTVCACILLYFLMNEDLFKRNIYLKTIGMSDIIVKSINIFLIPKIEEFQKKIIFLQKKIKTNLNFKHLKNIKIKT